MQEVVDASHGFSHFISYTDNGFEPSDVTIKRGQTVRFTNNSSRALWIMSSAGEGGVYPSGENACDQTAFDTCLELPPNDIREFTFDVSGSWSYSNNMNKTDVAVIHVK